MKLFIIFLIFTPLAVFANDSFFVKELFDIPSKIEKDIDGYRSKFLSTNGLNISLDKARCLNLNGHYLTLFYKNEIHRDISTLIDIQINCGDERGTLSIKNKELNQNFSFQLKEMLVDKERRTFLLQSEKFQLRGLLSKEGELRRLLIRINDNQVFGSSISLKVPKKK